MRIQKLLRAFGLASVLVLTTPLPAGIVAVELYPGGALVTREIAIGESGPSGDLELKDLPAGLSDSAIQIGILQGAALQLGGFTYDPVGQPVEKDDARTATERTAVDAAEAVVRDLERQGAAIQARIGHFKKLADSIANSLKEEADAETFELAKASWASVEEVRNGGEAELQQMEQRMRDAQIALDKARKDLNERIAELQALTGVLKIELGGSAQTGDRILVRYQVDAAGWSPVHEIRANPASKKVEWVYRARIWQRTGEDWDNVAITLNSSRGLYAGGLPELPPLRLNRMDERVYQLNVMARSKTEFGYAAEDSIAGARMQTEMLAEPESTTAGFFMRLPERVTLGSGDPAILRTALAKDLEADFWSQSVPILSNDAWLMAGLTNELGWPILAGDSFAYIDGQLVARRPIAAIAAGEEFELSLGVNEKIAIERKERVSKESEGGLIDKTKRHAFKFETIVTNRMGVAHRVVLQDRFPVGLDNKIQVRISSPKDVEVEEGAGLFKWERTVPEGGSVTLFTEYTVTYPADWNLNPPL